MKFLFIYFFGGVMRRALRSCGFGQSHNRVGMVALTRRQQWWQKHTFFFLIESTWTSLKTFARSGWDIARNGIFRNMGWTDPVCQIPMWETRHLTRESQVSKHLSHCAVEIDRSSIGLSKSNEWAVCVGV